MGAREGFWSIWGRAKRFDETATVARMSLILQLNTTTLLFAWRAS